MDNKPLAIVIGRNYTTRLCLIRSAGEAGCDVVVIQTGRYQKRIEPIDARSRYVIDCKISREPNKKELVDLIDKYKNDKRKVLLLPADDYAAGVIDQNLERLSKDFLLPHVNHKQGAIVELMDKSFQKSLASKVGLNVANGKVAYNTNGKYIIPEGISYPCFTKPLDSYSEGPLKIYLKKCNNRQELESLLFSFARNYDIPIIIEDYHLIEKEYAIVGLSLGDRSIIPSIIQMDSSKDGLTATGHIFPISRIPNLQKSLSEFMAKTKMTGLFDIDMYECEGKVFFNELNVRLGASGYALNKTAGNLAFIFVNYLLGKPTNDCMIQTDFEEKTFANEKVLVNMYLNNKISLSQLKNRINDVDILSLPDENDIEPYKVFQKKQRWIWFEKNYIRVRRFINRCLGKVV